MTHAADQLLELPILRQLRRRRYDVLFGRVTGGGSFRGVFKDFDEAARSAPSNAPLGYDVQQAGEMYRDRMTRVFPSDYPALFWLRDRLPNARRVFDLGGHVGVSYYAYRRYVPFPAGLRWTVCDVPSVTAAGAALAREQEAHALDFTNVVGDASGCDILMAAGSLQYIETPFADQLRSLRELPGSILVNKLATHPRREFVTLQNIGITYCPYRISARDGFPETLAPLGYRLVDTWENPDLVCRVPFHADAGPISYVGYLFERV